MGSTHAGKGMRRYQVVDPRVAQRQGRLAGVIDARQKDDLGDDGTDGPDNMANQFGMHPVGADNLQGVDASIFRQCDQRLGYVVPDDRRRIDTAETGNCFAGRGLRVAWIDDA